MITPQCHFGRFSIGWCLLAALPILLLPAGLAPKFAGPCGQALCNCEWTPGTVAQSAPHACCETTHSPGATPARAVLVASPELHAATTSWALQLLFVGLHCPSSNHMTKPIGAGEAHGFPDPNASRTDSHERVSTPPPRT